MTDSGYNCQAMDILIVSENGEPLRPEGMRNMFRYAAAVMIEELGLSDRDDVFYTITVVDRSEVSYCHAQYHPEDGTWEVDIELHKQPNQNHMLRCLAHELVHASQYVNGQLEHRVVSRSGKSTTQHYWMGQLYSGTDYHQFPWEQQAYDMEELLLKKVL